MATYHSNPAAVLAGEIGRQLHASVVTYEALVGQLGEDEVLWIGDTSRRWDLVILIPHEAEFNQVWALRDTRGPYTFHAAPREP